MFYSSHSFSPRKAFTLIEILVVIAIIGLLSAILFPVFARARESGRRASCASNLHQIGMAIEQYSNDYDGSYPFMWNAYLTGNSSSVSMYYPPLPQSWGQLIQTYAKSTSLFRCPSNPASKDMMQADYWIHSGTNLPISYAVNPAVLMSPLSFKPPYSSTIATATLQAVLQDPSNSILVGETRSSASYIGSSLSDTGDPGLLRYAYTGHNGTANYLFGDGHIKAMRPTQTTTPINMWGNPTRNAYGYFWDLSTLDPNNHAPYLPLTQEAQMAEGLRPTS